MLLASDIIKLNQFEVNICQQLLLNKKKLAARLKKRKQVKISWYSYIKWNEYGISELQRAALLLKAGLVLRLWI